MGPRSVERGNSQLPPLCPGPRESFNGAAFGRTRKPKKPPPTRRLMRGFNGAAFGRTRKRRLPRRRRRQGQRFNGAAFGRTRKLRTRPESPGRSTGFNGAAFGRTRKPSWANGGTCRFLKLQWGRVRSNAETASRLATSTGMGWLQWGRVRSNAETLSGYVIRSYNIRASMGPRSVERGNDCTA